MFLLPQMGIVQFSCPPSLTTSHNSEIGPGFSLALAPRPLRYFSKEPFLYHNLLCLSKAESYSYQLQASLFRYDCTPQALLPGLQSYSRPGLMVACLVLPAQKLVHHPSRWAITLRELQYTSILAATQGIQRTVTQVHRKRTMLSDPHKGQNLLAVRGGQGTEQTDLVGVAFLPKAGGLEWDDL